MSEAKTKAKNPSIHGYMGQIAYVNLTTQKTTIEKPKASYYRKYLGSRGIADRILWDHLPPNTNAFDPENLLIFSAGPFSATLWPCSGRYVVTAKSPQTNGLGYANSGGFFAPALKFAGFDALVVSGAAKNPVWVEAIDNKILIHPANDIWGRHADEAEDMVIEATGDKETRAVAIGEAGENLVRFAAIINDHTRAAGRTGMGAVMGSKKLKVVAAHGIQSVTMSDPASFVEVAGKATRLAADTPFLGWFRLYGTSAIVGIKNLKGDLPAKNMQLGQYPDYEGINGEYIREHYRIKDRACFGCPVRCAKVTRVTKGRFTGQVDEGVEYESIDALGPMVWNGDWGVIKQANLKCGQFGLDTISTGVVIAMAMELWQRGIITEEDTNGVKFEWGDPDVILGTIERIAKREGFGNILAEGTRIAAQKIGRGAEYYALHVKGVEIPRQEPRVVKEFGLTHAISNRGADHLYSLPTMATAHRTDIAAKYFPADLVEDLVNGRNWRGKAEVCHWGDHFAAMCDAFGICKFPNNENMVFLPEDYVAPFNALTGFRVTVEELLESAERIVNLERALNIREFNLSRKDDMLPQRFLKEKLVVPKVDEEGSIIELPKILDRYYELRGWTKETGRPTRETLVRLGLEDVADVLGDAIS